MTTIGNTGNGGFNPPATRPILPGGIVPPPGEGAPRRFQHRKPETPRRVRHGLKLHHKDGALKGPLAQRWMQLIEACSESTRMTAGLEYARVGQIVSMEVRGGSVEALVQGTSFRPYVTRSIVTPLTPAQWDDVIEAMAGEAVYVAKLLASELPATTDELFAGLGLALLPGDPADIRFECTCGDPLPCKHLAAVAYLLAERLTESPLLIFSLLGMPAERLLERVRRERTIQTHGEASAHSDAQIPETQIPPPPLEACMEDFWRAGSHLPELDAMALAQHVPHALLRRMGPSPMSGKFPLVGLLASIYDTVAASAQRLMDEDANGTADAADGEGSSSAEGQESG